MWKDKVKPLRQKLGLTQVELGALIGCTGTHVGDLEHGKRGKRLNYEIGSRLQRLYDREFPDGLPETSTESDNLGGQ
jgi:transcriptional regulator with XRE-family HTH domain